MNAPACLAISRFSAELILLRLRFLSSPQVMLETFDAAKEPSFSAEAWALAAADLVQLLEAGRAVDMNRTNTVILVEALEGSCIGSAGQKGWQEVANLLARRFEPFMGRRVILDIAAVEQ
ncbi:hypothetical protein [Pseudomonas gingeri]|uniref:hypothetical protein n=1 Tax=Pseudomonas gingeri TaxID=117681 RepID=UPI0015A2EDC3|nr:hypothetical protein [Pseudomonas gingeri]NWA11961.1 hypothetical protein [Pseudomonas gingeri]